LRLWLLSRRNGFLHRDLRMRPRLDTVLWLLPGCLAALWQAGAPISAFGQARRGTSPTAYSRVVSYPTTYGARVGDSAPRLMRGSVFFGPPSARAVDSGESQLGGRWYRPRGPSATVRYFIDSQTRGPLGLKRVERGWNSRSRYGSLAAPMVSGPVPSEDTPGVDSEDASVGPATRPALVEVPANQVGGIEGSLAARRAAQLNAGWALFKQQKYREAAETFSHADAIVSSDRTDLSQVFRERAETKVAFVYAAVAAGHYAEAANALTWLLVPVSHGRQTAGAGGMARQLPDPHFMTLVKDIRDRYADRRLFDAHLKELESHVQAAQRQVRAGGGDPATTVELVRLTALGAFISWSDTENIQSRASAKYTAGQLPPPWRELTQAMATAEADAAAERDGQDSSGSSSGSTSIRLPWESTEGTPATAHPAQKGG
jgi:hypothetical protein